MLATYISIILNRFTLNVIVLFLVVQVQLLGQDILTYTYGDNMDERGKLIEVDSLNQMHLLSEVDLGSINACRYRIIDSLGTILTDTLIGLDASAKDLYTGRDGKIHYLIYKNRVEPDRNGRDALLVGSVAESNRVKLIKTIYLGSFATSIAEYRIGSLSNGDYVLMSHALRQFLEFTDNRINLIRLDEDYNYLSHATLPTIGFRARCFKVVEEDKVLIGNPGVGGVQLMKVDPVANTIVWQTQLYDSTITYNRVYNPVILPHGNGYGIVSTISSTTDSLVGVTYYSIDQQGSLRGSIVFPDAKWSGIEFPSLYLDVQERTNIVFGMLSEGEGINRHVVMDHNDHTVLFDSSYDIAGGYQQARDVAVLDNGTRYMITSGTPIGDTTTKLRTVVAKLPVFSGLLSSNKYGRERVSQELRVYPNPNRGDSFHFDIEKGEGEAVVQVYSMEGKRMVDRTVNYISGKGQVAVPPLARGMYLIVVNSKKLSYYTRMMVVEQR
ncbi:T9SS type A sorting domain-containing protein [Neolewinella sp.]|uniref:T9SS type A sorting domain-containing protein n=1 Tax=Neolewinella sp. TaxID=2993543 RepID=UPI003B5288E8